MSEDIPIREYIDIRINSLDKYIHEILEERDRRFTEAHDTAVREGHKVEQALERRLELLNEFRAQQADEAKKYIPKDVLNRVEEALKAQIDSMRDISISKSAEMGRRVENNTERLTILEAGSRGEANARRSLGAYYGYLIAGISVLIAAATMVIILTR